MEPAYTLEPVKDRTQVKSERLLELFDHWQAFVRPGQAGGGVVGAGLPREDQFGLAGLHTAGPFHWWFSLADGGADFIGRSFGAETIQLYSVDLTGQSLLRAGRMPFIGRVLTLLRAPLTGRCAFRFWSEASVIPGRDFYDIEALSLPLSDGDGRIASIVGATIVRSR